MFQRPREMIVSGYREQVPGIWWVLNKYLLQVEFSFRSRRFPLVVTGDLGGNLIVVVFLLPCSRLILFAFVSSLFSALTIRVL